MQGKDTRYSKLVNDDQKIGGYMPPLDSATSFANGTITYTGINNDQIKVRSHNIAYLLRELREKKEEGWKFARIFKKMKGLSDFEDSLYTSPTTALLDYRLLVLGGHIHSLRTSKAATSSELDYLTTVYNLLTAKLQTFETEMGKLGNTRHQNTERQKLVREFQDEWEALVEPAVKKYQQRDAQNILKNVAAACTVVGLIWLFFKNLYRVTHGKGLGLFQFEDAHSRKHESMQKLYADVTKATAAQAEAVSTYFSTDIEDARQSLMILAQVLGELEAQFHQQPTDVSLYTEDEKDNLESTINAFTTALNQFSRKLQKENAQDSLGESQRSFMSAWIKVVEQQELIDKSSDGSFYPEECKALFKRLITIGEEFKTELENMDANRARKPSISSGSEDSHSS